jgi:hypothetical protein
MISRARTECEVRTRVVHIANFRARLQQLAETPAQSQSGTIFEQHLVFTINLQTAAIIKEDLVVPRVHTRGRQAMV